MLHYYNLSVGSRCRKSNVVHLSWNSSPLGKLPCRWPCFLAVGGQNFVGGTPVIIGSLIIPSESVCSRCVSPIVSVCPPAVTPPSLSYTCNPGQKSQDMRLLNQNESERFWQKQFQSPDCRKKNLPPRESLNATYNNEFNINNNYYTTFYICMYFGVCIRQRYYEVIRIGHITSLARPSVCLPVLYLTWKQKGRRTKIAANANFLLKT